MLRFAIWLRDAEPFVQVPGLPGKPGTRVQVSGEVAESALRVYEAVSGRRRPRLPRHYGIASGDSFRRRWERLHEAIRQFEAEPSLELAEELLDAWYQASVYVFGKEDTVRFYESHIKPVLSSFRSAGAYRSGAEVKSYPRRMRAWLRHARAVLREMTALDIARALRASGEEYVSVFGKPVVPSRPACDDQPAESHQGLPVRGLAWRKRLEQKLLEMLEAEKRREEKRRSKIERRRSRRQEVQEQPQSVPAPVPAPEPAPVPEPNPAPVSEPVQARDSQPAVHQPVVPPAGDSIKTSPVVVESAGATGSGVDSPGIVRRIAGFRPRR